MITYLSNKCRHGHRTAANIAEMDVAKDAFPWVYRLHGILAPSCPTKPLASLR